ncbi:MAG: hypothetical protein ACRDGD_11400 [Candidatus Limnocylindria bacterium]
MLGSGPHSAAPLLRAKGLTEERMRASGMTLTITQADVHMDMQIPRGSRAVAEAYGRFRSSLSTYGHEKGRAI